MKRPPRATKAGNGAAMRGLSGQYRFRQLPSSPGPHAEAIERDARERGATSGESRPYCERPSAVAGSNISGTTDSAIRCSRRCRTRVVRRAGIVAPERADRDDDERRERNQRRRPARCAGRARAPVAPRPSEPRRRARATGVDDGRRSQPLSANRPRPSRTRRRRRTHRLGIAASAPASSSPAASTVNSAARAGRDGAGAGPGAARGHARRSVDGFGRPSAATARARGRPGAASARSRRRGEKPATAPIASVIGGRIETQCRGVHSAYPPRAQGQHDQRRVAHRAEDPEEGCRPRRSPRPRAGRLPEPPKARDQRPPGGRSHAAAARRRRGRTGRSAAARRRPGKS